MNDIYRISSRRGIVTIIASAVVDMLLNQVLMFYVAMKIWRIADGDYLKPYWILFFVLISPYLLYTLLLSVFLAIELSNLNCCLRTLEFISHLTGSYELLFFIFLRKSIDPFLLTEFFYEYAAFSAPIYILPFVG